MEQWFSTGHGRDTYTVIGSGSEAKYAYAKQAETGGWGAFIRKGPRGKLKKLFGTFTSRDAAQMMALAALSSNQAGGKRTAKRSTNRAGRTTNPIAIVQDMPQDHYVASSHYTEKAAVAAARKRGAATVLEVPENRLYKAIWHVVIPKAR